MREVCSAAILLTPKNVGQSEPNVPNKIGQLEGIGKEQQLHDVGQCEKLLGSYSVNFKECGGNFPK